MKTSDQRFYLYYLNKEHSRSLCRDIVEKLVQTLFSNNSIKLKHDSMGAPFLDGDEHFISYSHTRNTLFVAISDNPIGVDTESEERKNELNSIKNYAFSKKDSSSLALLERWCLKEAALKKLGTGFSLANPNEYTIATIRDCYKIEKQGEPIDDGFFRIIKEQGFVFVICSAHKTNDSEIITKELEK